MTLSFEKINKFYGKNHALKDFTLTMTPGIYALLGPNGSGKSTLMNILTGNLTADSGRITYAEDGEAPEDIRAMGDRFRERLGYMPQYPGMYPNFTVGGFLRYMAVLKNVGDGMSKKARKTYIQEQISTILDRVELSDVATHKIASLSGGMKQRLALAQAVLGDPKVLILDEPTAGLDPKQRITMRNFISEIALDRIVLIATHVVSDVELIAREVILLRKGVVIEVASPAGLAAEMEGNVWSVTCTEAEAAELRARFPHAVTGMAPSENAARPITLRMVGDARPIPTAVLTQPKLEDAYLYRFGSDATEN